MTSCAAGSEQPFCACPFGHKNCYKIFVNIFFTKFNSQNFSHKISHKISVTKGFAYTERLWNFFLSENHVMEEIFKMYFCPNLFSKHRPSGPMLSISWNVRLSFRLSVHFEVPFTGLFAPTSRSQMSNIFRDSESLGTSNEKNWSKIWIFFLEMV